MCFAEKCQTVTAFDVEQSVLCSPVCLGLFAKYGHYSGILMESKRDFSAIKTEWRRGRDSNLRSGFERARADICVSYMESNSSEIFEDCMIRAGHAERSGFEELREGEDLAIVWLKVVTLWSRA
jgi:hypothetical protein